MVKAVRVLLVLVVLLATTVVAVSADTGTGDCVKARKAGAIAFWDSPNDTESGRLGDAISDGFFGNEPNLLNTNTNDDLGPNEVDPGSSAGYVVPSASPGPKTIGGGFTTWGTIVTTFGASNCAKN